MSELYKTTYAFSDLIHNLYGENDYSKIKEYHDISSLKKYLHKIVKSLRYSILETLTVCDKKHFDNILSHIDHITDCINKYDNIYDLNQFFLSYSIKICFLLLGEMPNRWKIDNIKNISSNWKLNEERQIIYTQTIKQKEKIIFRAIQNKYKASFPSWTEFVTEIYGKKCSSDPIKFVQWFKENHLEIYSELFY